MKKFLFFFAYSGAEYSGLQVQNRKNVKTVAGALMAAARDSLNLEDSSFHWSSRTDKGVSALCNAGTLTLQERPHHPVTGRSITVKLNKQLARKNESIRNVTNFEAMREGAEMMSGTHDFSYFTRDNIEEWRNPVKMIKVDIHESRGGLLEDMSYFTDNFSSWKAMFTGGSFLYRQVRFLMGTLGGLGTGHTTLDELHQMLRSPQRFKEENPQKWRHKFLAPASPLYLSNVLYHPNDLYFHDEEIGNENEALPGWLKSDNLENMNFVERIQ